MVNMMESFSAQFNLRSPAVKRLMKEAQELKDPTEDYYAQPLERNLFEWHFTVRGPSDSDFSQGVYHGRIILPTEYPMKPPSIIMLTPNGRGFGAFGALDYSPEERRLLALKSQSWSCPNCGLIKGLLRDMNDSGSSQSSVEDKELAKQIMFEERDSSSDNQVYLRSDTMPSPKPGEKADEKKEAELRERRRGDKASKGESDKEKAAADQDKAKATTDLDKAKPGEQAKAGDASAGASAAAAAMATITDPATRKSTFIIIGICLAIAFLLFRRLFLS